MTTIVRIIRGRGRGGQHLLIVLWIIEPTTFVVIALVVAALVIIGARARARRCCHDIALTAATTGRTTIGGLSS